MGKYKPETDSQGLCAAGATGCVDYTCTDCAGDRPCFHTHTQILTHAHTLAHANTDARCCRSVPARPLPHRLRRVAVPCCRLLKHAHPSCAKPWRASATSCMGPLARSCTVPLKHHYRRSPTSPVCFNPGATPGAVARSVRWATTRTCTPTRARAAAQFKTTKPCEREPSHRRACGSCLQRQNPHVCAAHPIGARCAAIVVMGSGARPAAG